MVTYRSDADDHSGGRPGAPEPLRELILAQGRQETGIFVLLFTSESADAGSVSADDPARTEIVRGVAGELGVDLESLTLFSHEAYVLQAALGEAALPQTALPRTALPRTALPKTARPEAT